MKQKERDLLHQMFAQRDEFVTSQVLASHLSLSDRTVRTYLNHLAELVAENGASIVSKPGYGYKLTVNQPLAFDIFMNQSGIITKSPAPESGISDTKERQSFILNKLLLEEEYLLLDDLSERLYVSRSTLTNDMSEIKEMLKPYRLTVKSRPNSGLSIVGKERDKRHFIMTYFFSNSLSNSIQRYMGNADYFKDMSFEAMTIIVLDECREAHLKVSDFVIQNLVLHLALSLKRISAGFEVQEIGEEIAISHRLEHQVAQRILKRIEASSHVTFPEAEVGYLTIHLMAKSNKKSDTRHKDLTLKRELEQSLQVLAKDTSIPFDEDQALINGLMDHLLPMMVRLENGIRLENPLLTEITEKYQIAFATSKEYLNLIPSLQRQEVSDDEWAYLALHLMAAYEKYKDVHKLQVLVICATGYGSAQLLKNRLNKEFGKHLTVVDVKGYYEITEDSLTNIDVIISSIDMSTLIFKVPVISVSVFLSQQDIEKIRHFIDQTDVMSDRIMPREQPHYYKEKVLSSYLKDSFIYCFDQAVSKDQVLAKLARLLSDHESADFTEKLLDQINQRGAMNPIVFSESIAVPHPAMPVGVTGKIAVGIVPTGLEWDSNYQQIKLVFLLSPSYHENENLPQVTKAIIELIDDEKAQEEIITHPEYTTITNVLLGVM